MMSLSAQKLTLCLLLFCAGPGQQSSLLFGFQDNESADHKEPLLDSANRNAFLVKMPLPITGRSAAGIQQRLKQILTGSNVVRAEDRPVVVLEFDTASGKTGQGSSLGSCIDLARFMTSPQMNRIKTVAYIPGKRNRAAADNSDQAAGILSGHAVLVALAADEIALHSDVKFGSAGVDEASVDAFVNEAYRNVVSKRLTLPVPVAMAMLDKNKQLFRVSTGDGTIYVDAAELKKLEADGRALETETLSRSGRLAEFSGKQLAEFGLIRSPTNSRSELARRLKISPDALRAVLADGKTYQAIRVEMPDYVDQSSLQWITRAMEPKLASKKINMVIFEFNSTAGDVDACLKFARRISTFESDSVQTVAYINDVAKGPAGFLALSCQHVIMKESSTIGGDFEPVIQAEQMNDLKSVAASIAETLDKEPAVVQAILDPNMQVIRFRDKTTGSQRLLTQEKKDQLDDSENWLPQGPLEVFEPISAEAAYNQSIARQIVSDMDELQTFYQLENEPELLKPTAVDRWLYQAGMFLASPFVAPWLLFAAMFFLFNEVSQPGLGVPGFLGTVCLILYFWSQHLDGNANWLEIMLFAAGILFVAIELFVVPGFGVFGIGGLLMIVISIVLAAQTFVFPTTSAEVRQLPKSIFALAGALGGTVFAMVVLRTILPNTPFFKKIMLEPPSQSYTGLDDGRDPESMVNWGYLKGKKGEAVTNLVPAGKARIGGQLLDVISDGRLVEKGQQIEVVEVAGNRVVVVAVEPVATA